MCFHGDSPGKSTRVSCHSLLQGIFLTQGSNLGLLHCRQILYHLSHQGSPGVWSPGPVSMRSSDPIHSWKQPSTFQEEAVLRASGSKGPEPFQYTSLCSFYKGMLICTQNFTGSMDRCQESCLMSLMVSAFAHSVMLPKVRVSQLAQL